jgi:hypothetical protein
MCDKANDFLKCKWVEESETNIKKCQGVKNSCSDISTSARCGTAGAAGEGITCIWAEETEIGEEKCQEVTESCSDISTSIRCGTAGAAGGEKKCIWILEAEGTNDDGKRCQEVKDSCELITRGEKTCEQTGSAVSSSETEGNIVNNNLRCIWVEARLNSNKCVLVSESCSDILEAEICNILGSVIDNENNEIECIWLTKNGSEPKIQCIKKV